MDANQPEGAATGSAKRRWSLILFFSALLLVATSGAAAGASTDEADGAGGLDPRILTTHTAMRRVAAIS